MSTCNWPLGNGQQLEFTIYSSNKDWTNASGLYIFSYLKGNNWYAVYVGQTDDFSSRLPNHDRLDEAVRKGATHIHAVVVPLQSNRNKWEKMLIQHLQPPLNTQHTHQY